MKNSSAPADTAGILERLSSIRSMERGKLTEYHRTRPAAKGKGTVRLGPYHKLQTWENGANRTRHIPAPQVAGLKRDLENHKEFKRLATSLEESIIAATRARRAGEGSALHESKKNSATRHSPKNTAKPRSSSPKPGKD